MEQAHRPCVNFTLSSATKTEVNRLFDENHYIGSQCADPTKILVYRLPGGLFGDKGDPIVAAIFAPPASKSWGNALELVRLVRRPDAQSVFLTKFLSDCEKLLKREKKFRLLVAYADESVGHHGGIYQAASWLYVGLSSRKRIYRNQYTGKVMSQRAFDQSTLKNDPAWLHSNTGRKHTYVFPLTDKGWRAWSMKHRPYPKPLKVAP